LTSDDGVFVDAEKAELELMEYIVDTAIGRLVEAIQEESQESDIDETLLEELKEGLETAMSLEEVIRKSLANQTDDEDLIQLAPVENEETLGKFYINRMRFWKQHNFEEATTNEENDVPDIIEYEEL